MKNPKLKNINKLEALTKLGFTEKKARQILEKSPKEVDQIIKNVSHGKTPKEW